MESSVAVTWITAADTASPANPLAAEAAEAASWVLYKLSGEKYAGVRTATDWYGLPEASCYGCLAKQSTEAAGIELHGHYFVSPSLLTLAETRGLRLRGRPVRSVSAVVDHAGATVDPSAYRLVNNAYLVKIDSTCWNLASGITVTYEYGSYPPALGKMAAITLANEFLKLYTGSGNCMLPERVTSVSRQGVSYTILDPQDFLESGRTGLYEVDLFLKSANPIGAKKRPRVFSPDIPRGER
jgi:hypothetical protein